MEIEEIIDNGLSSALTRTSIWHRNHWAVPSIPFGLFLRITMYVEKSLVDASQI